MELTRTSQRVVRHDRVLSLKHSCPDEEWEDILIALFSQKTIEGIQATARVEETQNEDEPPSHLTIEVRRSVQGITVCSCFLLSIQHITDTHISVHRNTWETLPSATSQRNQSM